MKLINIGFGNMVSANRLVAIVSPESAPIKRIIQDARESGSLIDATYGRRTRAVIITDSDHIILSAVQPETVANRIVDYDDDEEDEEMEDEEQEGDLGGLFRALRRREGHRPWGVLQKQPRSGLFHLGHYPPAPAGGAGRGGLPLYFPGKI